MSSSFWKKAVKWGILLWLAGYVLGIILYAVVPASAIGWIITPIGLALMLWVLMRKFDQLPMSSYVKLGII